MHNVPDMATTDMCNWLEDFGSKWGSNGPTWLDPF